MLLSRCVNYSSNGHFLWLQTIQYGAAAAGKKTTEIAEEEMDIVANGGAHHFSLHFAMKQRPVSL